MEEIKPKEPFVKKLILIAIFFTITPIALIACTISLISVTNSTTSKNSQVLGVNSYYEPGVQIYASLPNDFPSFSGRVLAKDARVEIIGKYLEMHNSPMTPYAEYIVKMADTYELDWRLTTAIAMKESGLGKAMPSSDCNNAWGYGIHSKGTLCFDSWEEGIETVSKGLKENYIDLGYVTPEEIMSKYAHPDSTTWAVGVSYYISQIK
jgi:hypothetical protein